jgi:general secretion pathway protein G
MRNLKFERTTRGTNRAGFTLMEILIVLAILAVIMALVLPNFLKAQRDATIKTAKMAVKNVEQAVEMYASHHDGEYPAGGGLDVLMRSPGNDPKWSGPYIKGSKLPADPWNNPIQYQSPGSHQTDGSPDIWSMGPDKQSGTADDITNWDNKT